MIAAAELCTDVRVGSALLGGRVDAVLTRLSSTKGDRL